MSGVPAPRVSVVVPTFDAEACLREAVRSVFGQTWPDWELIVVDDGSTDGTGAYLAALNHPRVRVISLPHCGNPARVRNAGLAAATGTLVAFLDADDRWLPRKLEMQVSDLVGHPPARWSYTDMSRIDAAGRAEPLPPTVRWRPVSGRILPELLTF